MWEWGGLERLNVLMWVPINHTIDKGVLTILELDVLGRLHLATRKSNVKGDIVCTFI